MSGVGGRCKDRVAPPPTGDPDPRVVAAVVEAAADGRLPCARALELARRLGVSPREVGAAADSAGVRITACQLGCFG
ncbi:MAG: hypothetical protein K6T75_00605 [Acetobacteraceae bacterium]|nr:hypothetical protein [Acetobacteraceae bacterium]